MKPEPTADWRLNPIAERAIQEGQRFERRRQTNRWLLGLSGALGCPFACLGSCLSMGGLGSSWPAFLILGSVGLLIFALVRVFLDKRKEGERLDALRKEFGDVRGWLVQMSVRQGEALSGRDVGIVWFEDARLYFAGSRTSFGLGVGDAQARLTNAHEALDGNPNVILPLQARTLAGPTSVELRFLHTVPEHGQLLADDLEFKQALKVWFSKGDMGHGQLPPLSFGPDIPSIPALRRRALVATALWPTLATLIVAAILMDNFIVAAVFMILFIAMASWPPAVSPRRCWRALRDREALDATIEG